MESWPFTYASVCEPFGLNIEIGLLVQLNEPTLHNQFQPLV